MHEPHKGYVVAELSVDDLVEVYRLRELLEAEAIRVAVPRLTTDDLAAIETAARAVDAAGRAGDTALMTEANREFHFLLFDVAGLPRLARTLGQLWDATDVYRAVYFSGATNRTSVRHEHRALLDALVARDAEAAVTAQHEHRENSVTAVSAALTR